MKFNEALALNHVAAFHDLFDAPVLPAPAIPSEDRCVLRVNLIQEELNELKEAIENRDMVAIADALGDLQYVLSGAILEFGLGHHFADLFNEIQRSNMSKACTSWEEAEQTAAYFQQHKGVETKIVQKGTLYMVYRLEDNKVLKSVNYSAADLERIVSK